MCSDLCVSSCLRIWFAYLRQVGIIDFLLCYSRNKVMFVFSLFVLFMIMHMKCVISIHMVIYNNPIDFCTQFYQNGLPLIPVGISNNMPSKVWDALQWRHNGCDCISNHQLHHCLRKRLFRRRSKKTSKLRVTGLVRGIHRWPVNSPHKEPVTRKMFQFDDVIMEIRHLHYIAITVCVLGGLIFNLL